MGSHDKSPVEGDLRAKNVTHLINGFTIDSGARSGGEVSVSIRGNPGSPPTEVMMK